MKDILTQTPELPEPYEPVYKDWLSVFEQFEVNSESVLVGHSCGGGFLVRWLSETDTVVDKLVLVAPWLDPEKTVKDAFFDFKIDKNLKNKAREIHILVSDDDEQDVLESVEKIRNSIDGYIYHEFKGYGHFTFEDMGKREFSELLAIVLGESK